MYIALLVKLNIFRREVLIGAEAKDGGNFQSKFQVFQSIWVRVVAEL